MKKQILFGAIILLSGCACPVCEKAQPEVTVVEIPAVAAPCSYSCIQPGNCLQASEPMVLKPRVTEKISHKKKRRCCPDEPILPGQEDEVYVPDAPEIYVISANRTMNSMQKEAEAFYKQAGNLKIFVDKAEPKSDDLPGGMDKGSLILQKRFKQMDNITVVANKGEADYVVSSSADWYDTATKKVPAIKYDLLLKDKSGKLIGEWSEIVHQADGDRSWW